MPEPSADLNGDERAVSVDRGGERGAGDAGAEADALEEDSLERLAGKTILITGATSGLGLEAGVKLARLGGEIVLVARNRAKGEAAAADVKRRSGSSSVAFLLCDFASQASIRAMAAEFLASHGQLHVLINNAGGVSRERVTTVDGIEQTFAVNHLGYFLTTSLLIEALLRSAPARIVNVASAAQRRGTIDFANLQYEAGGYSILGAYARSKLANVLFTRELARRLAGTGVTVNCLHPGMVATDIWSRPRLPWVAHRLLAVVRRFVMISAEQGADRIVFLAASPDLEGKSGGYYENDRLVEPAPQARDTTTAARLWQISEALVNR